MECICGRRERRSTAPSLRPRSIECPCEAGRSSAQVPEGDPMRLRRNAGNLDGLAVDPAQLTQAIQKRLPQLTGGVCSGLIKSIPTRLIWPDDAARAPQRARTSLWRDPAMNWRRRMAPPKDTRAQTMSQPNTFLTAGQLETIFNPLQPNVRSGSKAARTAPNATSALPRSTDIKRPAQLVRFVPIPDLSDLAGGAEEDQHASTSTVKWGRR